MFSLTYVSLPMPLDKSRKEVLEDIHAVSLSRNSELDITGLLISTNAHFAQVLEGPEESVEAVMASIIADPRHSDVVIFPRSVIAARKFQTWRFVTFDRETFADFEVTPLLETMHTTASNESLWRFSRLVDAIARSDTRG